jgi:hypothetical protein
MSFFSDVSDKYITSIKKHDFLVHLLLVRKSGGDLFSDTSVDFQRTTRRRTVSVGTS